MFASSCSIYGDAERYPTPEEAEPRPLSPYGITKLACEHLVSAYARSFGLDAVVAALLHRLRPAAAAGHVLRPGRRGARDAAGASSSTASGEQSRSFTYVGDAVEATIAAAEAPTGALYNVGGGEEATCSRRSRCSSGSPAARSTSSATAVAAGDVRRTKADVSRIGGELGWAPRTSLEDGLRAQWEWAAARVGAR